MRLIDADKILDALVAYEATGLKPEEVKNLVAEVERLRQMFEPVCPKCGLANCRGIWKHTCDRCGADMREKTKHEN